MAESTVSVVVLNWNGREDTVRCLESLQGVSDGLVDVVVVDNGSTDGSIRAIRDRFPSVAVLENGRNLGYAGGNNVGIRHALQSGAEFVLVLNNDAVIAPDTLRVLRAAARRNPEAGVFGARINYLSRPDVVWFDGASWDAAALAFSFPGQNAGEDALTKEDHPSDYACGAALFFRAELGRRIGLFDERFFLVYEESDWCLRARAAGYGCIIVPRAKVWHQVGASFGTEESPLRAYYSTRNRLLWAEKNLRWGPRGRVLYGTARMLTPALGAIAGKGAPMHKRVLWALVGSVRNVRRASSDLRQQAMRRGLRDYLARRFGECPGTVMDLHRRWLASHSPAERAA